MVWYNEVFADLSICNVITRMQTFLFCTSIDMQCLLYI